MSVKTILEKRVNRLGYELGCYDNLLNKLDADDIVKVVNVLEDEYCDIAVTISKVKCVVEMRTVDNEKDFSVITEKEYVERYGDND